jgi:SAM-dependent methyltransferase
VTWIVGDVTNPFPPPASIDLWHDRAAFHFLVDPGRRDAYIRHLRSALKPGGHVLIATFSLRGPTECSSPPVCRYDPADIHAALGDGFEKIGEAIEEHRTPQGASQSSAYCFCRRDG